MTLPGLQCPILVLAVQVATECFATALLLCLGQRDTEVAKSMKVCGSEIKSRKLDACFLDKLTEASAIVASTVPRSDGLSASAQPRRLSWFVDPEANGEISRHAAKDVPKKNRNDSTKRLLAGVGHSLDGLVRVWGCQACLACLKSNPQVAHQNKCCWYGEAFGGQDHFA